MHGPRRLGRRVGSRAARTLKERLKNVRLVGRCYDLLYVDPIDLSSRAARFSKAFDIQEFENIPDWPASKPVVIEYRADFGGGSDKVISELSSSDFQTFLKREKSLSVGDPTCALFAAGSTHLGTTSREPFRRYVELGWPREFGIHHVNSASTRRYGKEMQPWLIRETHN